MPSVMQTTSVDAGVGGFHDGVGGERRRHEDDARRSAPVACTASLDGVEDREAVEARCRPCRG